MELIAERPLECSADSWSRHFYSHSTSVSSTLEVSYENVLYSATCPYCNGADETAEHLVLHCSAHEQARRDIWPGGQFNTDP